ncbi:hypothetical protein VDP25_15775 [Winogradskyella sp. ECml5-4]|uniref:hypothetical protein n=1 Tax=Winogradskyella sp. ECml5-4 TaxID=3110975 RepID=UPI002FF22577
MRDNKFYTCAYCFKEFEPKRRRVQRYCSNTCRSKAYHARKTESLTLTTPSSEVTTPTPQNENMSLAGVGNAAAGSLAAQGLKHVLTAPQNRPATKADIENIASKLKRYHKVKNLPANAQGALPYFDIETKEIKYPSFMLEGK